MKPRTLRRLLSHMKGKKRMYITGIAGMAVLLLAFQIVVSLMFLTLFDALQVRQFDTIWTPLIRYMVVIVSAIVLIPFFSYMAAKAAIHTTGVLRKRVYNQLSRLPIATHHRRHSAELSSIATNDIAEAEQAYAQHMITFAVNALTGLGAGIVMFIIEWRLALVAVLAALITLIVNTVYAKRLRRISTTVQARLAGVNTKLSNVLAGVSVIRVFNLQKLVMKTFMKANQSTLEASQTRVKRQATIEGFNTLVWSMSFAGITLLGGFFVLEGLITLGVIVAVTQLQNSVLEFVEMLGRFVTNLQSSLAAGDRVFELLDEDEEPLTYEGSTLSTSSDTAVAFEDVSFAYAEDKVLDRMTFRVQKNRSVALVGPSGGGKTTVFKLILQFFAPQQGRLAIDGVPTAGTPIETLRDKIAYVPQDAHVFNTTIRENIAYGNPAADETAIVEAAKAAGAHAFITSFDQGYDTIVGEQGTNVSGGQRQRIAIARAILKDAPILLLDEATSALDTESEALVQRALLHLMKTKTVMVIAHRLSTIEHADQVLVVKAGHVVEEGTHGSLLDDDTSLYAKLYRTQQTLTESDDDIT